MGHVWSPKELRPIIRTWVSLSKSHDGLELGYIRKAQYLR
nr:MAG TPA: hypothetical protein [Caudoviricetes sp.]